MPKLFLAKTEPSTYSISDFEKEKTTLWDGVHNFQAINFIKMWQPGDFVLIYHSVKEKAIVGLARVIEKPYKNDKDPRTSWAARLEFVEKYEGKDIVTLQEIKETGKFANFYLLKNGRLSVMDCPEEFEEWIKKRLPQFKKYLKS